MTNNTFMKYFMLILLMAILILLTGENSFSQGESDSTFTSAKKTIVSASFQYQNLPDTWDIKYYGFTAEIFLNDNFSYSGSLYFGKGSDNLYYGHFPAAGAFILLPPMLVLAMLDWASVGLLEFPESWAIVILKTLLLENIHLNIHASDRILISPSLTLLGAEGEAHEEGKGSETAGGIILTTGAGMNIRLFLTERFTINSNLIFKHYFTWGKASFGDGDYNGYTLGLNLGYVF